MNNRILIVDDHAAVRMAMHLVLASEGYDVVAEASNGKDALTLLERMAPLTVILDICLPVLDGLGVMREIASQQLPVKIVVFTGQSSAHLSTRCRRLGAHGFVCKQDPLPELVKAVNAVRANQKYYSSPTPQALAKLSNYTETELLERLSVREFFIMQQLLDGLSSKEIGEQLQISNKTVSTYKTRIFHKLNIGTLMDLYALGERNHLK